MHFRQVKRRDFITLLGGATCWPLVARAQQGERVRRVGVLMNSAATDAAWHSYLTAFVQGLHQLGWIEGQNLRIDTRWSAGDSALARIYAAQLIGLMPDAILASSTTNLMVIQQATGAIPVVFVAVSDPVAQGFVANVTHPGAISPASACTSSRLAANGSTCSRSWHPSSPAWASCSIQIRRPSQNSSCA